MKQICNLEVDVQMMDNGKLDVYISNKGNSGCHYNDISSARVGELVAEEINVRAENYPGYLAKDRLMEIVAVERDGLNVRTLNIIFEVKDPAIKTVDDLHEAIKKASREYISTEAGRKTLDYNCGCFNLADFEANVPQRICEKYGFAVVHDTIDEHAEMDWDEQLF